MHKLQDELCAWLILARAPGVQADTLTGALRYFADARALVCAPLPDLLAAGFEKKSAEWLRAPPAKIIDGDLRWLQDKHHHFIYWESPDYPDLLKTIGDAPVGLFVQGDPSVLSTAQLAIVGSRNPTPAGREHARSFAAELSSRGLTITSGLAIGIDTAGHRGALDVNGKTIAVCGTGLDSTYPHSNQELARKIAAQGALVSEFAPGTPAVKSNFPRRNRLISGLSLGTLVVEAALRSGSLITARLAAEQGREVFAVPGAISNPLAQGCHRLIQQGARLAATPDEIFTELFELYSAWRGWLAVPEKPTQPPDTPGNMSMRLDKDYEILLDALGFEPAGVDLLVERTGLRADEVASMLLILELEQHVASYPGGLYVRARIPRQ